MTSGGGIGQPARTGRLVVGLAGISPVSQGILLMAVAVVFLALLNTIAKELDQRYSVVVVVWVRYVVPLTFIAVLVGPQLRGGLFKTRRLGLQVARALLLLAATALNFAALRYLPLAETTSVSFLSPLLVVAFSVTLLGEPVGLRSWLAIALGLVGTAVILRPGSSIFGWPLLLPLGQALCYSLYLILTRRLAGDARPEVTLFYSMLIGATATSLLLPIAWTTPRDLDIALMAAMGIFGGIGHFLLIKAFERAPAATLAPIDYSKLVWSAGLGLVVFGDLPDMWSLVGMVIVAISGLYVIRSTSAQTWPPGVEHA